MRVLTLQVLAHIAERVFVWNRGEEAKGISVEGRRKPKAGKMALGWGKMLSLEAQGFGGFVVVVMSTLMGTFVVGMCMLVGTICPAVAGLV